MTANDTYMLEGSRDQLSLALRCTVAELSGALPNLKASGLGDVETHSNGNVTLLSRRLKREFLDRKNSSVRVARFREKRKCNDPGNGKVPLALVSGSGSGSDPVGNEGAGRKGFPTAQLMLEVGKHFGRGPGDSWSYVEEEELARVARRPQCLAEWSEIIGYYRKPDAFPRHSVLPLLQNWGGELDKARNYQPNANHSTTHKQGNGNTAKPDYSKGF
jgi:hypothetical protein